MSVEFYRGSPGKFDSRTLSRTTLNRWTGRTLTTPPEPDPPVGAPGSSRDPKRACRSALLLVEPELHK